MRKPWVLTLFRRRVLVALLILLQLAILLAMIVGTSRQSDVLNKALTAISLLAVLYIINRHDYRPYKLMWAIQILLFPVLGGVFYLLFRSQSSTKRFRQRQADIDQQTSHLLPQDEAVCQDLRQEAGPYLRQAKYLSDHAGFPVYQHTAATYLSSGEMKLAVLLQELRKAEQYIFLEYFIIQEGIMWNSILDILVEKANQGVEVRLIYDDVGCFLSLPGDYPQRLAELGIKVAVFNPFRPVISATQNNRDHRKIVVIDGKVAITGGANLSDKYINAAATPGHWKDAAIMVKGQAAWSFSMMFLKMWSLSQPDEVNFERYLPDLTAEEMVSDGFIQPYADSPLDYETVGEHVYLQIINSAKDYVYINTPYLIVDDVMLSALCLAAKSGIDVRIVTPHRWDRWFVHMTTRSYYPELIAAGVKIYEYSDGFIHAKTFVSDDLTATVGTANLDYRSLYLAFECGVWLHNSQAALEIKEDFLDTLRLCQQVALEDCRTNWVMRLVQELLRLFAPLM